MRRRPLGKTGIEVSEIALGTWGLCGGAYGRVDGTRAATTFKRALELGITTFDAAPSWGLDGASEQALGEAISERRDGIVIVTRAGVEESAGRRVRRFDPRFLEQSCETSLARLHTDRIDVLLLHGPDEETLRGAAWRPALEGLVAAGKVRCWGASVGNADLALAAIDAGAQVICLPYNLLHTRDLHDIASDLTSAGCGLLARSPLSYGLLSGNWVVPPAFGRDDHRRDRWTRDDLQTRLEHVAALRFLVHHKVPTLAIASLGYVLSNELVSAAIIGPRGPTQLEGLVNNTADGPPYLDEADLADLPRVMNDAGILETAD